jgi:hypothetical protein
MVDVAPSPEGVFLCPLSTKKATKKPGNTKAPG